jgi:hypothetical protein
MGDLHAVESLGFTLPTPPYLAGAILFGLVGFAAYRYGKKTSRPNVKWIGIALMVYPLHGLRNLVDVCGWPWALHGVVLVSRIGSQFGQEQPVGVVAQIARKQTLVAGPR